MSAPRKIAVGLLFPEVQFAHQIPVILKDLGSAYLHCWRQFALLDRKIARHNFEPAYSLEIGDLLVDVSHGGLDRIGNSAGAKQVRMVAAVVRAFQ